MRWVLSKQLLSCVKSKYSFVQHRQIFVCSRLNYSSNKNMAGTFSYEDQLPNLTVPSLETTIQKYLYSVRAVATDDEYENTKQICQDFLKNEGPVLHSKLKERERYHRNWIEQIWLDVGYLQFRLPLSYLNFSGTTSYNEQFWPLQGGTQVERVSFDLHILGKFWKMLRNEELPPHTNNSGIPFSMHQFRTTFNTCRIPHRQQDELISYFKTVKEGHAPSHSVIICQGRIFKVDLISKKTGEPYTPPQLAQALQSIVSECNQSTTPAPGIAALTSLDRDTWADIRDHMISLSETNHENLKTIQSAVNLTAMQNIRPSNFSEMMSFAVHGDATHRWLDKSYNAIWGNNGSFMANCDHTAIDGMVFVMYIEYITMQLMQCGGKWTGSMDIDDISAVEELKFTTDDRILSAITEGKTNAEQLRDTCAVMVPIFDKIGKVDLKANKIYPDAFFQISLQLAYMRMHGKPACTYETATTRQFYHGRTETCRTCTPELVAFCRAVIDGKPKRETQSLLRDAHDKFIILLRDCQNNKGCDRHLLGLSMMAASEGKAVPEIFTDPMYKKSGGGGNFVLSTSFVGFYNANGAVPPMVEDGYGVFYRVNNHRIVSALTAWNHSKVTNIHRFNSSLEQAFLDVFELFRSMKDSQL